MSRVIGWHLLFGRRNSRVKWQYSNLFQLLQRHAQLENGGMQCINRYVESSPCRISPNVTRIWHCTDTSIYLIFILVVIAWVVWGFPYPVSVTPIFLLWHQIVIFDRARSSNKKKNPFGVSTRLVLASVSDSKSKLWLHIAQVHGTCTAQFYPRLWCKTLYQVLDYRLLFSMDKMYYIYIYIYIYKIYISCTGWPLLKLCTVGNRQNCTTVLLTVPLLVVLWHTTVLLYRIAF